MHTLNDNYKAISLLHAQSITTTTTGTGIDVEQYEDDAQVILDLGSQAGTTETLDVTIETSAIGDFTDKVTAVTFAQVTGTNGDNLIAASRISLAGIKKVRAVATKSSTGADLISVILLARARVGGSTVNSTTPA